ncbi:MAG: hypothetical protein HMLKMBBP_03206 [Planctomycetes bacterium]|nr:hypothetical protein [Planctomycetota bacterium]
MPRTLRRWFPAAAAVSTALAGSAWLVSSAPPGARTPAASAAEEEAEAAQIALGERLFLETRFAQRFAAFCGGDVNSTTVPADPVLERARTIGAPEPGRFRDGTMNCRACHLVDEHRRQRRGDAHESGVRTYADFARRSPVPRRADGAEVTLRNSPSLVGASVRRGLGAPVLHFDGEFRSPEDLVVETWTGRNFGWLPGERARAIRHIAAVIRGDDGRGELAHEFGGRYRDVFAGTGSGLAPEFVLPPKFRIDVTRASDERVVRAAARLVGAYLRGLDYSRDALGRHAGSPYDLFLHENDLPRAPAAGETPAAYSSRLLAAVERLRSPRFVDGRLGSFALHGTAFAFGAEELRGLKVFLRTSGRSGAGNCASCHAPPLFTDHNFHNTGVSQAEYDRVHGAGAFAGLDIPALADRNARPDDFLPATHDRPEGSGVFASIPSASSRGRADLGLWNVLFDPGRTRPQARLAAHFSAAFPGLSDAEILEKAVAAFKTPSLRDLAQSGPYLHDGSADTIGDAVRFYVTASELARSGGMRNAPPQFESMQIDNDDAAALAAFLRSLAEDYE